MTLVVTVVALGAGAIIDTLTRRIPNLITIPTAALGVVLAGVGASHVTLAQSLSGLALGMLLMMPGYLIGATGAGDVKLLGAAGAVLGVSRVPGAFLYAAIAGGIFALVVAAMRRHRSGDRFFAYGPAIALGCVLAAFGV